MLTACVFLECSNQVPDRSSESSRVGACVTTETGAKYNVYLEVEPRCVLTRLHVKITEFFLHIIERCGYPAARECVTCESAMDPQALNAFARLSARLVEHVDPKDSIRLCPMNRNMEYVGPEYRIACEENEFIEEALTVENMCAFAFHAYGVECPWCKVDS